MKIEIKNRFTGEVICDGDFADLRDCIVKNKANLRSANLRNADLRDADLWGADLRNADLWGADLRGADLRGAKNYFNFIDFCIEIIRKQADEFFTDAEWVMIGKIYVNRWCWETIKKNYGEKVMPILEKISKSGFDEYEEYYKGLLREVI